MLTYLKKQAEAHPLVILDIASFFWINCLVNARMGHIYTYPFPKGTWDGICGMNPAVCVEDIFRDVFGVNTINWIAHILSCSHNEREGKETHNCECVVQPKDSTVNMNMADLDQVLEASENVQHFGSIWFTTLNSLLLSRVSEPEHRVAAELVAKKYQLRSFALKHTRCHYKMRE